MYLPIRFGCTLHVQPPDSPINAQADARARDSPVLCSLDVRKRTASHTHRQCPTARAPLIEQVALIPRLDTGGRDSVDMANNSRTSSEELPTLVEFPVGTNHKGRFIYSCTSSPVRKWTSLRQVVRMASQLAFGQHFGQAQPIAG